MPHKSNIKKWAELEGANLQGEQLARTAGIPIERWLKPLGVALEREDGAEWVIVDYGSRDESVFGTPTSGLLERFLRLEGAPAVRVRDFVKRFGLLHAPTEVVKVRSSGGIHRLAEQVLVYRRYAGLLRSALALNRRLNAGERVDPEDLMLLREFILKHGLFADRNFEETVASDTVAPPASGKERNLWLLTQWWRVSAVVNWWLEVGRVRPVLRLHIRRPPMIRWSGEVWGAIGGLALFAVRHEANVAVCDYCGREFALSRRPRSNAKRRCCGRSRCVRERRAESMRWSRRS